MGIVAKTAKCQTREAAVPVVVTLATSGRQRILFPFLQKGVG